MFTHGVSTLNLFASWGPISYPEGHLYIVACLAVLLGALSALSTLESDSIRRGIRAEPMGSNPNSSALAALGVIGGLLGAADFLFTLIGLFLEPVS